MEDHLGSFLHIIASDVPLEAQKSSKKHKLEALWNESDMEKLFGQLKEYNVLLNTILKHLQRYGEFDSNWLKNSDKQDKMIDMMTNQEKNTREHVPGSGISSQTCQSFCYLS